MVGPASASGQLAGLCLATFLGLLLLLGLGETDLVTTAPGVVRPVGESIPVQAPRDGRIAQWSARVGVPVAAGFVIGSLDVHEDTTRLAALTLRGRRLTADTARLRALLEGFAAGACDASYGACAGARSRTRDDQHGRELALELAERRAARARIRTQLAERHTLAERLRAVAQQLRWQQPECTAHRRLARGGGVAEVQWWAAERRCAELEGLERSLAGEEAAAVARLAGQEEEEARRRATVHRAWGEALAAAQREHEALAGEQALLREQLALAQFLAPARGRLDCMRPGFIGVWVRAGEVLCNVLPEGVPSEVQVALPEHARDGIHAGQVVSLRVLALPWMRHGLLTGRVATISADTHASEEPGASPSYRVTVHLDPESRLTGALEAGMRVEADFHRGREPLWRWLLAPLADLHLRAAREP